MFTSQRVPCFLNTFAGHGDDPESKELKLVFHVTPISADLATEVSPQLADRLFRKIEDEWQPVREMPKASFASIMIHNQNITFFTFPDSLDGVLVPGASISNLRAQRAFSDGLDFRLEFDVVVQMNSITMRLVEQFYKATCFLSMEAIQRDIEYPAEEAVADHQGALQDAADGEEVVTVPAEEAPSAKGGRKRKAKDL